MFENATPTFLTAFFAGLLSFVSPCVLPLIPGYLSYISGVTLDEMQGTGARRRGGRRELEAPRGHRVALLRPRLLGRVRVAGRRRERDRPVPAGHEPPAAARKDRRGRWSSSSACTRWACCESTGCTARSACRSIASRAASLGAFLVGLAFAFGWTPCIGPILAGILTIAGAQETVGQGIRLLAVYSLGLGVPFLLTSIAINQFFSAFARIRKHYHAIEVTSGVLLCAIGVLIFTNRFTIIAQYLSPYLPTF